MNADICRIKTPGPLIERIEAFRDSADSDQLRMVNPLIYQSLKNSRKDKSDSDEAIAQMEKEYYMTTASNIRKLHAATKILKIFEKEDVLAVPVKGIASIEALYHDPGVRPMADIDLLIKQEDTQRVKDILANKGYPYIDSYRGSIDFTDNENQAFDLHSRFTRFDVLFHIDYDEIYSRLIETNLNGQIRVEVLCPEHQLIHIALHLAPGLYSGLNFINLMDIYYLIRDRDRPIDWEYLIGFSTRSGMNLYIYGPIYLCAHLLNAKVPESVLEILETGLAKAKTSYIQNEYFESILNRGSTGLKILFERIKWADGFPYKLKLLRMALFPDRSEMVQRYQLPENSLRIYGFYMLRIGKLLKEMLT